MDHLQITVLFILGKGRQTLKMKTNLPWSLWEVDWLLSDAQPGMFRTQSEFKRTVYLGSILWQQFSFHTGPK